jgi:hypothetical protein
MILLSKILKHIKDQLEVLKDNYSGKIDLVDGDDKEALREEFVLEYDCVLTMISDERSKLLYNISTKILVNQVGGDKINTFIDYCEYIRQVNDTSRVRELIVAKQSDFIYNYFEYNEKRLLDNLDSEQWNFVPLKVDQYFNEVIKLLEKNDIPTLKEEVDRLSTLKTTATDNEETSPNTMLVINGKQFKVFMKSILEVVEFTYGIVKDRQLFDPSTCGLITKQLMKVYISFSRLNHDIVLEAKGFKLKSITPKEVSILCSNINIIKNHITLFIGQDDSCNEAFTMINEILTSAKSKFIEVYFPQT